MIQELAKVLNKTETIIPTTARVLAEGFVNDPMLAFLFPDFHTRVEALTNWFQLFVKDGCNRGTVTLAPADQGAIIWYPADVSIFDHNFDQLLSEVAIIVEKFGGLEAVSRFQQLGETIVSAEPDLPHCEVFWLALLPKSRGQGLGGNLLQPVLQSADSHQVGCYLVASHPRSISFYEKHGFRQLLPLPIGDQLLLTAMWRDAQTSL
ncbi:GNAT family N-acetyltransferase [Nostocales cyanobacterium LEGE 11386]|nr:GNAT family N-acetyltransferase [Nostocales cyanobacterium LEGE 11386]